MSIPLHLVLVRHGESEGNKANELSRKGDNSAFTPEFRNRHGSSWRLTSLGIEQAKIAGKWLKENGHTHFDRYYCSNYVRALETAAHLELDGASWRIEYGLRERDKGIMEVMPENERQERFPEHLRQRALHRFYWYPPEGESLAEVCTRIRAGIMNTLHRECTDNRIIIVCHGEVMRTFQTLIERLSAEECHDLEKSKTPTDRIYNTEIIEYSRVNPQNPNDISPFVDWVRRICPYDQSLSSNIWQKIDRTQYSNAELLAQVEKISARI